MNDYLKQAKAIEEEVIGYRHYLHAHPELAHELPVTTKYVLEKLEEFGIDATEIADSAVVALIGKPGKKTILLRADMDALAINEEVDLDFKSTTPGRMHACGHDMHTAMLLGAAKILKENEDTLEGQVKLMFQPAEESLTGAPVMIEAGLLENPKVDVAAALHVFPAMYKLKPGTLSIQTGSIMAGSQNFKLEITGKGCHGAMPETGIDPISIAFHIFSQVNTIKMREVSARDDLVITFGQVSFGESFNIIPNEGVMQGTFRFFDAKVGEYALKRFEEIIESTTKLFGGTAKLTLLGHTPPNVCNEDFSNEIKEYLIESLGEDYVTDVNMKAMGSEDFSFVTEKVPSVFIPIIAGNSEDGYDVVVHNPGTKFDEKAMVYGVATHVTIATEWLKNNQ